jgi:hypothetical protein
VLHSKRTLQYLAALEREGDNFDYFAWLKRVREEDAREKAQGLSSAAPEQCGSSGVSSTNIENTKEQSSIPLTLGHQRNRSGVVSERSAKPTGDDASRSVRNRLMKVYDAWDESSEDRSRDSIYPYLKAAYAIVRRYQRRRRTNELLRCATKFAGLPFDRNADPFATIIRCTCAQELDGKTISKIARALRYAAYRNRPPRLLKSFVKGLGGINACADLYAKRLGRAVQAHW